MNYQLAIFDLDGTILDTLEDLTNSVNFALRNNQFEERSIDEVCSFVGNGIRKLIERAVPSGTDIEKVEQVFADFKQYYALHCTDKTKPYEGIMDVIRKLRQAGCKTAVVSNKADSAVGPLCQKFFPEMFDYAVGEREGIQRKPSPDSVLEVLEHLCVEQKDAIYIGDSEVDIQTAKNAGIGCISVTWGFRKERFLAEQGATLFAKVPEEIEFIILGRV